MRSLEYSYFFGDKDALKMMCFGSERILQQHFKSNRIYVPKIVSVKSATVNDYAKKRPTKDHRTLLMDVNEARAAIHLVCLIVYIFYRKQYHVLYVTQ